MIKKQIKSQKPSSVIAKKKFLTFSVIPGAKNISYENGFKNGKPQYAYIPNTKANRDEINRLKGKPEKYGKRLIWW